MQIITIDMFSHAQSLKFTILTLWVMGGGGLIAPAVWKMSSRMSQTFDSIYQAFILASQGAKWQLEFWQRRGVSDVNTAHSA